MEIKGPHNPRPHSVGLGEQAKASVTITCQASFIKPEPKVPGGIFAIRGRRAGGRQPFSFRMDMKGLGSSLPTNRVSNRSGDADPDITVRVFKQTEHVAAG